MQRLSVWARWIAAAVFTLIIIPLIGRIVDRMAENVGLYDREALPKAVSLLLRIGEMPWVRATALGVGCFAAGLWVDWLLRRLDSSRAEVLENLGYEMLSLCGRISDASTRVGFVWPDSMADLRMNLTSIRLTGQRFGVWVPDHRIYGINDGLDILEVYLHQVGTTLRDGQFTEAKQAAMAIKGEFDQRLAQSRGKQ
jgi:hypothetical protein